MRRTSAAGERRVGQDDGYTLVELLVVIAVLAAIVMLASPMLPTLSGQRLQLQAELVGEALRNARAQAIRDNREVLVEIDVAQGVVSESGGRELARLAPEVQLGLVAAATERVDAETGGIRFLPDGSSSGGELVLARDGRRLAVRVDWFDGSVEIGRADGL